MNAQATYEQVELLMDPGDYERDPLDRRGTTVRQAATNANTEAGRTTA